MEIEENNKTKEGENFQLKELSEESLKTGGNKRVLQQKRFMSSKFFYAFAYLFLILNNLNLMLMNQIDL